MLRQQMQKYYIGLAVIAAICVGAIIWYYVVSRGPANDQQKAADIVALQSAIGDYANANDATPDSLDQLKLDDKIKKRLNDYDYSRDSTNAYTICANFASDASAEKEYASDSDPSYHGKGRQCFTSDVYLYDPFPDDYKLESPYNPESSPFDSLYQ